MKPSDLVPALETESPSVADPVAGTGKAFLTLLFNRYRGALFSHVSRLVSSREDAAELVQETYLRVMQQAPTAEFQSIARAYLFQTATNLARDHFRRQRWRAHERLDSIPEPQAPPGYGSPEELALWGQAVDLLAAELHSLPAETQAVFRRARLENQDYATIARELGISVRSVERRMSEAMQVLTSRLEDVL